MKKGLAYSTTVAVLLALGVGLTWQPGVRGDEPGVAGPELTLPGNGPTAPALVPIPPGPDPRGPLSGRYRWPASPRPVTRPADGALGAQPPLPDDVHAVQKDQALGGSKGQTHGGQQAGDWDGPGTQAERSLSPRPRLENVPSAVGAPLGLLSPMPKPATAPEKPQANKGRLNRLNHFGTRESSTSGLRLPTGRGLGLGLNSSARSDRGSSVNGPGKGQADPGDTPSAKARRSRGENRHRTASHPGPDPNAPGRR